MKRTGQSPVRHEVRYMVSQIRENGSARMEIENEDLTMPSRDSGQVRKDLLARSIFSLKMGVLRRYTEAGNLPTQRHWSDPEVHMHQTKPEQDNVAPSRDGVVSWWRKKVHEYFITPLLKSTHPPWFDARGVSLGLAVGFAVPVGGQVAFLGLLRAVFRFNFLAAVAFSFVSNPFNMIPLYYGYYRLGCWITGMSPRIDFHMFGKLMHPITQSEYFWEALASFMALSKEILIAWVVTAAILASSSALIGYVVTHRVQVRRASRRAQRLEQQYEKIVEEFEDTH